MSKSAITQIKVSVVIVGCLAALCAAGVIGARLYEPKRAGKADVAACKHVIMVRLEALTSTLITPETAKPVECEKLSDEQLAVIGQELLAQ
jgi:hypothetical protein